MAASKITLSAKELSMVTDTEWILTKQAIIQKVYELFGQMIPVISETFISKVGALPQEVKMSVPKISKGENYKQLPYVMLDHPRYFEGDNIFALRTMFWWGNFISITIHLSGKYKQQFEELIFSRTHSKDGLFICMNSDQWQHHFEEDNYMPWTNISETNRLNFSTGSKTFVKVAMKFPLIEWEQMPTLLQGGYDRLSGILA